MPSRDLSVNYKIEFRCAWQTNKQTKNYVKHCKEGKKQKDFLFRNFRLAINIDCQFTLLKAKQLTVFNAFPDQDFIRTPDRFRLSN
jgi:hypothetical protein